MNQISLKIPFIVAVVWLGTVTTLHAESPREQLNALVTQLQANPGDNALREQIIKLVQGIDPPPAIPEDARQHFVEGKTITKSAQSPEQQGLAVQSFEEALKTAPWWGDAYFNLAVAQELAGQLDAAQESLKLYIQTNPGEEEARDAQDRIYALNAKKKLAAANQNSPESIAERERKFLEGLEGTIWVGEVRSIPLDPGINSGRTASNIRPYYVVRNRQLVAVNTYWYSDQSEPVVGQGRDEGSAPLASRHIVYTAMDIDNNCNPTTLQISEDGNSITRTYACFSKTFTAQYKRVQQ